MKTFAVCVGFTMLICAAVIVVYVLLACIQAGAL